MAHRIKARVIFPGGDPVPSRYGSNDVVAALFEVPEGATEKAKYNPEYSRWEARIYADANTPRAQLLQGLQQGSEVDLVPSGKGGLDLLLDTVQPVVHGTAITRQTSRGRALWTEADQQAVATIGYAEHALPVKFLFDRLRADSLFEGVPDDQLWRLATGGCIRGQRELHKVDLATDGAREQQIVALAGEEELDVQAYLTIIADNSGGVFAGSNDVGRALSNFGLRSSDLEPNNSESLLAIANVAWRFADLTREEHPAPIAQVIAEFGLEPQDNLF